MKSTVTSRALEIEPRRDATARSSLEPHPRRNLTNTRSDRKPPKRDQERSVSQTFVCGTHVHAGTNVVNRLMAERSKPEINVNIGGKRPDVSHFCRFLLPYLMLQTYRPGLPTFELDTNALGPLSRKLLGTRDPGNSNPSPCPLLYPTPALIPPLAEPVSHSIPV